ncbi:MAG TPA: hypothetical protein VN667_10110, partial [Burkholderiales bacterium]|nr:hypothetical protein [Burkholderiales bacterium]
MPSSIVYGLPAAPADAARRARLRSSQRLALAALLAAAALAVIARWGQPRWPALGYLAAFAEAAVV